MTLGVTFPWKRTHPPSVMICWAVIWAEAGETRKSARPAISLGVPVRPVVAQQLGEVPGEEREIPVG